MTWGLGLRAVGTGIGALIALWGVLPAFTGRLHAGSITMIVVGLLLCIVCVRFSAVAKLVARLWQPTVGKIALVITAAIVATLMLLFTVVSVLMICANFNRPVEDATVIVLGAGLRGERPSRILRERLDATVEYLGAHPQAVCIVSGGQGGDEVCTEASVMRSYLLDKGIAEERIYVEDKSTSTFENIAFSQKVIEKEGLNPQIAMVTQEFHQYRAQQFAKAAGFTEIGAITAHTPWELLGSYWIRDFAGICHMVLLGR